MWLACSLKCGYAWTCVCVARFDPIVSHFSHNFQLFFLHSIFKFWMWFGEGIGLFSSPIGMELFDIYKWIIQWLHSPLCGHRKAGWNGLSFGLLLNNYLNNVHIDDCTYIETVDNSIQKVHSYPLETQLSRKFVPDIVLLMDVNNDYSELIQKYFLHRPSQFPCRNASLSVSDRVQLPQLIQLSFGYCSLFHFKITNNMNPHSIATFHYGSFSNINNPWAKR